MATFFATQAGAGANNGTSLANAWNLATFNGTITPGPGDTVLFSGNITGAVSPSCNGNSSAMLTLDFSSVTFTTGYILFTNNTAWVKCTGGTFATNNPGSPFQSCVTPSSGSLTNCIIDGMTYIGPNTPTIPLQFFAFGSQPLGITAGAVTFCTIQNCHIDNCSGAVNGSDPTCNNITFLNNYFRVQANTIYQTDVIFISDCWNITIQGNMIIQRCPGDNASGQHNDGIQTFHSGSSGGANPSGWIVRYNWIALDMGNRTFRTGDNSWMQLESLDSARGFAMKIYGNVFWGGHGPCFSGNNGFGADSHNVTPEAKYFVYNNTIIRHNGPDRTIGFISNGIMNFRNNIFEAEVGESGTFVDLASMTPGTGGYDYNYFFNVPDATSGQAGAHGAQNTDPQFVSYSGDNFALNNTSPCLGAGDSTIGAEYAFGIAPGSTWPNPTLVARNPGGGGGPTWDIGAFQAGGAAPPPIRPMASGALHIPGVSGPGGARESFRPLITRF